MLFCKFAHNLIENFQTCEKITKISSLRVAKYCLTLSVEAVEVPGSLGSPPDG